MVHEVARPRDDSPLAERDKGRAAAPINRVEAWRAQINAYLLPGLEKNSFQTYMPQEASFHLRIGEFIGRYIRQGKVALTQTVTFSSHPIRDINESFRAKQKFSIKTQSVRSEL